MTLRKDIDSISNLIFEKRLRSLIQSGRSHSEHLTWKFLLYTQFPFEITLPEFHKLSPSTGRWYEWLRFFPEKQTTMIYIGSDKIQPLERLSHDKDQVRFLNDHGLHIYLYEPMCSYHCMQDSQKYTQMGCYGEFTGDVEPIEMRSHELDSITIYIKNNGLNNVIVHTGDYNVEKFYPYYSKWMNLICDDILLRSFAVYNNIDTSKKTHIKKKFISTNWRFTPARAIVSAVLHNKESYLSWKYTVTAKHTDLLWLKNQQIHPCLNYLNSVQSHIDIVSQPVNIEHWQDPGWSETQDQSHPVHVNNIRTPLQQFYRESFVDVVCETRYAQPTANISEKVFQSIKLKTPFLLVAPPGSLEYLKKLGYATFSNWWDESYDQMQCHAQRLKAIIEIIEYLDSKSLDQLYEIYDQMYSVLTHNFSRLVAMTRSGRVLQVTVREPQ